MITSKLVKNKVRQNLAFSMMLVTGKTLKFPHNGLSTQAPH